MSTTRTGGCQCGAVRYRFADRPGSAHICHCRMCQKATGGVYAPWVGAVPADFVVTRGEMAWFLSSDEGKRGFCANCGTQLAFAHTGGMWLAVSIGSLDDPESCPPLDQRGVESRLSYVPHISHLPDRPTTETEAPEAAALIRSSSRQHPDHDTGAWPLKELA